MGKTPEETSVLFHATLTSSAVHVAELMTGSTIQIVCEMDVEATRSYLLQTPSVYLRF